MKKILITLTLICIAICSVNAIEIESSNTRAQGGTGYKINDVRTFEIDENTIFMEDGEVVSETRAQGGTGFKIRYKASDVNPNITQGTLTEIDLINIYTGPVVSVSPLKIFDVDALISNKTFFADGIKLKNIKAGDVLSASGFVDISSAVIITRIASSINPEQWKLSGYIDELSATHFKINNQMISYSENIISDCQQQLRDGDFVEIIADADIGFILGDVLDTSTAIKCIDESVNPKNPSDNVVVEGMINQIAGADFILSGQNIEVNNSTRYIRGRTDDIQENIKVEVEGVSNSKSTAIIAAKIRFLEPRINLTLPVLPEQFSIEQVNVAGVYLSITPQILDPDGLLINGLNEPVQLQLKGYDYGSENLYLTRINQRGEVDYNDVSLNGFLTAIDEPMIELFGVGIETAGADFFDTEGIQISSSEFYQMIEVGAEIEVESATLDPTIDSISGGVISIVELPEEINSIQPTSPNTNVIGIGTLTDVPNYIFKGNFE